MIISRFSSKSITLPDNYFLFIPAEDEGQIQQKTKSRFLSTGSGFVPGEIFVKVKLVLFIILWSRL